MKEYPDLKWIKKNLRWGCPRVRYKVLDAYIVGSEAKGTARPDSDLDIAVIINPVKGKDSLKFSERYHDRQGTCGRAPEWQGRKVDFQFFYPYDEEPGGYNKIRLPE